MLKIIGILLIIWLAFIVLGAIIKGLLWLLVIGIVLFAATSAYGWIKRQTNSRI